MTPKETPAQEEKPVYFHTGPLPICPWCEQELTDSPANDIAHDGEEMELECAECFKKVMVKACITARYSTRRKP